MRVPNDLIQELSVLAQSRRVGAGQDRRSRCRKGHRREVQRGGGDDVRPARWKSTASTSWSALAAKRAARSSSTVWAAAMPAMDQSLAATVAGSRVGVKANAPTSTSIVPHSVLNVMRDDTIVTHHVSLLCHYLVVLYSRFTQSLIRSLADSLCPKITPTNPRRHARTADLPKRRERLHGGEARAEGPQLRSHRRSAR